MNNKNNDQVWLNAQFDKYPNAKNKDLAAQMGAHDNAVSKIRHGQRKIAFAELTAIKQYFDSLDKGYETTETKKVESIPPLNRDKSAENIHLWDDYSGKNLSYIIMLNDDMAPEIRRDDKIIIDKDKTKITESGIYALNAGDIISIRHIEILPNKTGDIVIRANHPDIKDYTLPNGEVEIIGQGVFVGKKL
jgi:hypothetical protein